MQITSSLDIDVVALESEDRVTAMLELVAPALPDAATRAPATVQVVLDRSGSMGGPRLDAAIEALLALVDRLAPTDRMGVVAFDDDVRVVVPAGPLADRAAARAAIRALTPGGMTNLSAGLLRGFQEARRVADGGGATIVVLSDGHANGGETRPERLAAMAHAMRDHGLTTATIGIGLDYDERLLGELATGGQGDHLFAEHGDAAGAALASQVDGLLSRTVQAASLIVRPQPSVSGVTVWGGLPSIGIDGGVMIELGDLWAGEMRRVTLSLDVPAMPALGLAHVAELELRWVELPAFAERVATLPISVNVVPGDEAAGRIPNPIVVTELVYQQVQDEKRRAADALARGDHDAARSAMRTARSSMASALGSPAVAASPAAADLREELEQLANLEGEQVLEGRTSRALRSDASIKGRKRGRGM